MSENIIGDRLIFRKVPIIKKQDQFFHQFGGTIIIEIAEGNNLTDIDVFLMILVRAITLPKVSCKIRQKSAILFSFCLVEHYKGSLNHLKRGEGSLDLQHSKVLTYYLLQPDNFIFD